MESMTNGSDMILQLEVYRAVFRLLGWLMTGSTCLIVGGYIVYLSRLFLHGDLTV